VNLGADVGGGSTGAAIARHASRRRASVKPNAPAFDARCHGVARRSGFLVGSGPKKIARSIPQRVQNRASVSTVGNVLPVHHMPTVSRDTPRTAATWDRFKPLASRYHLTRAARCLAAADG